MCNKFYKQREKKKERGDKKKLKCNKINDK